MVLLLIHSPASMLVDITLEVRAGNFQESRWMANVLARLRELRWMGTTGGVDAAGILTSWRRAALAAQTAPKYERRPVGSRLDAYEGQIRAVLAATPSMRHQQGVRQISPQ